ncbi:undecaprenyl-phosphate alpha-N-acetylglucosaminephosphotransferase [Gluconacetobacter sacchari DSM 12717]|nr:glycosyl transferase [Gluconacetobacter sacchari]GBQ30853.1 undecaprenyl-phosphate alpha-N-acetylglucosaminephosphotransferase [Gluconacetobacter sacchari DSM 12717]
MIASGPAPGFPLAFPLLLLATWITAGLLVAATIRLGVMDHPGHRSSHTRPTPKGGGIGIVTAFVLAVPIGRVLHGMAPLDLPAAGLLAATILLGAVSWLDDVHQWPPILKLGAQVAASVLVALTLPVPATLPWFVLSVAILVFMTNAVNFMDGLNGLVSGSVMLACLALGVLSPGSPLVTMVFPLAAALTGFLPFNFPAARIFMGDVGSQTCGLLLGAFALVCAFQPGMPPWYAVPMLLAGLIYDVVYTLARRWRRGARLMEGHREHLYQRATQAGLSPVAVTLILWSFVLWGGVMAYITMLGMLRPTSGLSAVILPQLAWSTVVERQWTKRPGPAE